jgi:N-formylglutamate amidohydrolase
MAQPWFGPALDREPIEQSGFRPEQQQAYQGAKGGWQQFFAALEQVLARID